MIVMTLLLLPLLPNILCDGAESGTCRGFSFVPDGKMQSWRTTLLLHELLHTALVCFICAICAATFDDMRKLSHVFEHCLLRQRSSDPGGQALGHHRLSSAVDSLRLQALHSSIVPITPILPFVQSSCMEI